METTTFPTTRMQLRPRTKNLKSRGLPRVRGECHSMRCRGSRILWIPRARAPRRGPAIGACTRPRTCRSASSPGSSATTSRTAPSRPPRATTWAPVGTRRIIPALRPVLLPRFPVPVLIFRCASTRRRVLQVCLCPWPTQPLCLTQQATPRWPACLFRFRRLLWRCRLRTRRTLRTQECTTVGLPCRPRPARGPWLLPPAPRA
mmetsp:Transcript_45766/g.146891  ORF Transcript_45766/g.146891 Transcript_45766/m.146891 type:complete len:203 (+) Transcript_45766:450-1058(+)